jgi:hypothetical protein
VAKYHHLLDGVLFPYRHEQGQANLTHTDTLINEVNKLRDLPGTALPIILDVYAPRHSRLVDSTADYVKEVMTKGREYADGVMVYCHQHEKTNPEKYRVIKEAFAKWAARKPDRR